MKIVNAFLNSLGIILTSNYYNTLEHHPMDKMYLLINIIPCIICVHTHPIITTNQDIILWIIYIFWHVLFLAHTCMNVYTHRMFLRVVKHFKPRCLVHTKSLSKKQWLPKRVQVRAAKRVFSLMTNEKIISRYCSILNQRRLRTNPYYCQ